MYTFDVSTRRAAEFEMRAARAAPANAGKLSVSDIILTVVRLYVCSAIVSKMPKVERIRL
jgi:hypothetical protein